MRRIAAALTGLAVATAAGCVTVGRTDEGNPIPWSVVARVQPGTTTMTEVLAWLGAPDEMQRHPDGTMLLWRVRLHDYARFGFEPDRLVSFLPADRIASTVLSNLSLVIENGAEQEDRLALLVDDDAVVQGLGVHRGIPR